MPEGTYVLRLAVKQVANHYPKSCFCPVSEYLAERKDNCVTYFEVHVRQARFFMPKTESFSLTL